TNQHKGDKSSNVEEIAFVPGRPELRSTIVDAYQLDRKEAIWQMDREDRNRKQNDGRNTHERNEGSDQESDASENLGGDCDPSHNVRQRNTRRMKNASERCWSPGPFRQTVCQKSITNNKSKGDRCVWRKLRPDIPPIQYTRCQSRHLFDSCVATSLNVPDQNATVIHPRCRA